MNNHARSTGVLTTSTLVATGRNFVSAVIAGGDGTNVATINIYDGTSNAGTKIMSLFVPATARNAVVTFPHSITVDVGIYAEVSGTGANVMVAFGG